MLTARDVGWDTLKNGALLAAAAKQFDVLLTADQNIKSEQDLSRLPMAVVVLVAEANSPTALEPLVPRALQALGVVNRGELIEVHGDGRVVRVSRP